jgi:3D (Asp-Asp-Asp) domain-containing protein
MLYEKPKNRRLALFRATLRRRSFAAFTLGALMASAVQPAVLSARAQQADPVVHAAPLREFDVAPAPPPPRPRRWDSDHQAHPGKGQFRRFFRMTATAYTPINTRMEGGRYTFTERDGRSAHGVAVDPDLIPLGSRLWIPGYGHAVADDIGGAIRGHRIDLRMQDAERMRSWGVRRVRVYVLEDARDDPT